MSKPFLENLPPAPSASAPDGMAEGHVVCVGWTVIETILRDGGYWSKDSSAGVVAADDLVADPPVRSSTRPPAIDGQARADAMEECAKIADKFARERLNGGLTAEDIAGAIRLLAAAPPAQGSAGWRDAIEAAATLLENMPSHYPRSDLVANLRALAPPVEAQESERMQKLIEAAMADDSKHQAGETLRTPDGSLRTYYAGFNLTQLSKHVAAALGDSSPATVCRCVYPEPRQPTTDGHVYCDKCEDEIVSSPATDT